MLRSHGLPVGGRSIPGAFFLEMACRIQIDAQSAGGKLTVLDPGIYQDSNPLQPAATQQRDSNLA